MTKIVMTAGALLKVMPALQALCANRLPITLSVKVSRMHRVTAEFHGALMQHIVPLIAKHTDGGNEIGPDDGNHPAFLADAKEHFAEQIELDIDPVALSALETAPDVSIEPHHVDVLLELGFIITDAS